MPTQVSDTGLQVATIDEIQGEISTAWKGAFGASMDTSSASPDGQLIGIISEQFAIVSEALEALAAARNPSGATGRLLRALCALTGTTEIPPAASSVTLYATGTPTATIPIGSLASTLSTGQQFVTTEAATIAAVSAWSGGTAVTAGILRTNSSKVYLCTTPGTTAASGGPTATAADITDGTAHWTYLGRGTGAVTIAARSKAIGPIVGVARDIARIDSPAGGWQDVINLVDATLGRSAMSDPDLRLLREIEIAQPGTGPVDAIRAAMLRVSGVTACTVFANLTDITDANGVPPHGIEVMIHGGDDQAIRDALLANVPAGTVTYGTISGTSYDSSAIPQTIMFSRVTEIPVYVVLAIVVDPAVYVDDSGAAVALAVASWGNAQSDGRDVDAAPLLAPVFGVPGVLNASLPLIGTSASPSTSTSIAITLRQRAVFDTSRISVSFTTRAP